MNESIDGTRWLQYLEIPERKRTPVKLEQILAERIEAFMRVKKVKTTRPAETKHIGNR